MLKWLVTRGPSSPTPPENEVTDDPLATISKRGNKSDPIYAVSRVNPIFEEEEAKISGKEKSQEENVTKIKNQNEDELPGSPPTDRESVRSSGYGSKEADSVSYKSDSQEEEDVVFKESSDKPLSLDSEENSVSLGSPGTVAELRRSFEKISTNEIAFQNTFVKTNQIEIITKNENYVQSIEISSSNPSSLEVIPEDNVENEPENPQPPQPWPRVSHLAQALQRQAERIHRRRERERLKKKEVEEKEGKAGNKTQVLRFNPLVSVVAQDMRYVTAISVSPKERMQQLSKTKTICGPSSTFGGINYQNSPSFQIGHMKNYSQNDSIPILFNSNHQYNNHDYNLLSLQPDSLINEDTLRMMHFPDYNYNPHCTSDEDVFNPHHINDEDDSGNRVNLSEMPKNFGRATMYAGFPPASKRGSSSSQESLVRKEKSLVSHSNSAKKKGLNTVKDLWEKSGLKTNGRKLIVDVNDLLNEENQSLSRGSSYGNAEDFRSFQLTFPNKSNQFRKLSDSTHSINPSSSHNYEEIPSFPHTSSMRSYEDISGSERGIDNPAFIDDKGNPRNSATSSLHSKSGHQFQHNLTNFQKRVSEKLQGEPDHRKSWLDLEKAVVDEGNQNSTQNNNHNKSNPRSKDKSCKKNKKDRTLPGRAVREFGLTNADWRKTERRGPADVEYSNRLNAGIWVTSESNQADQNNTSGSFGRRNRLQFWESYYGRYMDGSLPVHFNPHPNSEAQMCERSGSYCHDFTLDARRSHRIMQKSSKSQRRRRCCSGIVIVVAFLFFIGVIVGVSWYSTGGERLFGPM